MVEQEKHILKGCRARILSCQGNHGDARGTQSEGCVCQLIGQTVTLGNRLILMTLATDSFRIEHKGERKLIRLTEVRLISPHAGNMDHHI